MVWYNLLGYFSEELKEICWIQGHFFTASGIIRNHAIRNSARGHLITDVATRYIILAELLAVCRRPNRDTTWMLSIRHHPALRS